MWSMLRHMVFIPPMCLSQIQKKSYYYVESLALFASGFTPPKGQCSFCCFFLKLTLSLISKTI